MDKQKELEVKRFMAAKIAEGVNLSDVQKLVNQEFGLKLTYMDVRILASELDNIDWDANDPKAQELAKEKARAEAEKKRQEEEGIEPEVEEGIYPVVEATPGDGRTVVEVSKLVRPGTALSGTVKFASGSTADWYVDSYGRLGIENLQGDKPTESDIMAFQDELKKALGQ